MREPVDHILRPCLPWRNEASVTECGYDAGKVKTITREQFMRRVKDLGQQRAAMLTCMTCSSPARRWGTWADDPREAIGREIDWESKWRRRESGNKLRDELIAIAALIERHREEFTSILDTNRQRQDWIARKVQRGAP